MTQIASLDGRRALVTGAASGIGLAIARELTACGAEVLLSDLSQEALHKLASEMPRAVGIAADLSSRDGVKSLIAQAGAVDILVNNAGIQHVSPVHEFDEAKWDFIIAVMLTAPFLLTKAVLSNMYQRGWGRIINIGSVHSLIASPYKSAYVSAKHGLYGLTKTVALEAGEKCPNVTANALCPSYVRTPLVDKQIADQARAHGIPESQVVERILLTQNAIKRLIDPADCAKYVAFLCRDESWCVTGAAVTMDAGWLAH